MARSSLFYPLFALPLCLSCVHTIHIAPTIDPTHLNIVSPYPVSVGLFVDPALLDQSVVEHGSSGDSVRYYPYLALIKATEKALPYIVEHFTTVGTLPPYKDGGKDIHGVLAPRLKGSKGSYCFCFWPPTSARVEATYTLYDLDGKEIWSDTCAGEGQWAYFSRSYASSFDTAFKSVIECILGKMNNAKETSEWVAGIKKKKEE